MASDKILYPEIEIKRKQGWDVIVDEVGNTVNNMLDFWEWAYSDVISNSNRGILAEYLVASALGIEKGTRTPWDNYDLLLDDKIKIEVKSSSYLQAWGQKKLYDIKFSTSIKYEWCAATNAYNYEQGKKRLADVFVFCLLKEKIQEDLNPLDLKQWDFYVLSTQRLNEKIGCQQSISLKVLLECGVQPIAYLELKQAVYEEYGKC